MAEDHTKLELLAGYFPLKAQPEVFLKLFESEEYYTDVQKFVRRVDNDAGIPFLKREEYDLAKRVLPSTIADAYEDMDFSSQKDEVIYLRGKRYYLNHLEKHDEDKRTLSIFHMDELERHLTLDFTFCEAALEFSRTTTSLDERMLIGSFFDLYKHHLLVLFTGFYECMRRDGSIPKEQYNLLRKGVETSIVNYYQFVLAGIAPEQPFQKKDITEIINTVRHGVYNSEKVYDKKRSLYREFDHPGRMVMYASHLLSQIKKSGKRYNLLVNLLNGSVEMGIAVQAMDKLLGGGSIDNIDILNVDFARYSMKDEKHGSISAYNEFEQISIPPQLRRSFRRKVDNHDVLLVDDNLNTGASLYNARLALQERAKVVDISVAEVTPEKRVIELTEEQLKKEGISNIDPYSLIKLSEKDLTYEAIGEWRDQPQMLEEKVIQRIIGVNYGNI